MKLVPKNWNRFQHYKDRNPPWIKFHRSLLNDREFMSLPIASKALAPLLWLLASESQDGVFDASTEELAFRLRLTVPEVESGLKPLIRNGMFLDASTMLAPCLQDARPETETERETETKKVSKKTAITKKPDDIDDSLWDDWCALRRKQGAVVSQRVVDSIRKEATIAGLSIAEAMDMMIVRSWRGFQAGWVTKTQPKQESRIDQLMRIAQ